MDYAFEASFCSRGRGFKDVSQKHGLCFRSEFAAKICDASIGKRFLPSERIAKTFRRKKNDDLLLFLHVIGAAGMGFYIVLPVYCRPRYPSLTAADKPDSPRTGFR